ncbi:MAG: hypothetical protein IIX01_04880 [Clostridia bacterium]|nr:hypothetical protein [Clostridia bacterium]
MYRRIMRSATIVYALILLLSISGVFAFWRYYDTPVETSYALRIDINEFNYQTEDVPQEEEALIQRLYNILNCKHETDTGMNSRDYLINETIQVRWDPYAPPYVGSMDQNYAKQIDVLFGDVLTDTPVSFILKNQDLNWDGYSEISLYSTSDLLDSTEEWPKSAVCVYLTVFTPVIDEQKNIIAYEMVCESLRGFAPKVRYGAEDLTPSFSTDHWRDDIGYMVWNDSTNTSDVYRVPADAMSNDGTKPFRYDYASYSQYYQNSLYYTTPYGNTANQCLNGKIPWLS